MSGLIDDAERRIDEERTLWQQKKVLEAEAKAKREREAAEKARRQNSNSWLF